MIMSSTLQVFFVHTDDAGKKTKQWSLPEGASTDSGPEAAAER